MTFPDPDILSAVKVLLRRHGDEAPQHAARRANECKASGDPEGWAIWTRICIALNELVGTEMQPGERRH
jgi:hypothetical protein